MNERIKLLAEQAGFMEAWFSESGDDCEREIKKFAELVVGHAIECVRDVLRDENSDLGYAAASQVQNRIKEHFGVEQ